MQTDQNTPIAAVILAAGKGTRMKSQLPKVLHALAGAPMLTHVLQTGRTLSPERMAVVTGHGGEAVAEVVRRTDPGIATCPQTEQRGTGHAVLAARPALEGFSGDLIVLYGDTPLLTAETLGALRAARADAAISVLGFETDAPGRYGRLIVDHDNRLDAIVEAADASDEQLAINKCNAGVMVGDARMMLALLDRVGSDNAQGEIYLTDIVALARSDGLGVRAVFCAEEETLGVNDRVELARAEAVIQSRLRDAAMRGGATLVAPETVFLSHDTVIGRDVIIEPNVILGPGVTVEDGVTIRAFSHLDNAHVSCGSIVGPYARLRPGAVLAEGARIGNFVEVKNATIGTGSKVNHLSYIGDAALGAGVNIGAGTITCNYDGFRKHRTEIADGAFVGVNTALVAPVSVGEDAYIATGTTVTRNVPADALAISRTPQNNREGTGKRLRESLKSKKD